MVTYVYKLDIVPGGIPTHVHLSQYDDDFEIVFKLFSSNGELVLESGTTCEISGTKRDGNGYSASATLDVVAQTATVTGNVQMTAISGDQIFELSLVKGGKVLHTANFILRIEHAAMDADTVPSESMIREIDTIVTEYLEDHDIVIDDTLTQQGKAADAKAVGDAIAAASAGTGLTNDIKAALLALMSKVAYVDENGQYYYDALEVALYPPANLASISAVYTQPGLVYETDSLDSLKSDLVVTALYDDSSTNTVTNYILTGTLTKGTSTITVTYGGKTTTFAVNVSSTSIIDQDIELTGSSQTLLEETITYDTTKTYSFVYTFGAHTPVSTSTTLNRSYGPVMSNGAIRDGALQYNGSASEWRYVYQSSGVAFTPSDGDVFCLVHNFATQATTYYLNDTILLSTNVGPSFYTSVGKIVIGADNAQMTVAPVHIKIAQGDLH